MAGLEGRCGRGAVGSDGARVTRLNDGHWVEVGAVTPDRRGDAHYSTAQVIASHARTIGIFAATCGAYDDGKLCGAMTPQPPDYVLRDASDNHKNFVHAFSDWEPLGWATLSLPDEADDPPLTPDGVPRLKAGARIRLCPTHAMRCVLCVVGEVVVADPPRTA